jgi:DNA-binding transcriptional LysR family regulator
MNMRQLQAFRAVMLIGTVTGAGELLRLTQPTISKLVADLEHEVGLKLFERASGRLIPRAEAHTLLHQVDKVFTAMEDVERNARQLGRGQAGHLRLVAIPALALDFLPGVMASFLELRPDVTIELNVRPANRVVDWIATNRATLGFASDVAANAGVTMEPFRALSGVVALPSAHPLSRRAEIEPRDLAGERFISLGRDATFRHHVDRIFEEAGVARRIAVETGISATACALVRQGAGVAIIDPMTAVCQAEAPGIVLRPFRPEVPFTVHAVFARHAALPVLSSEFLEHAAQTWDRLRAVDAVGVPVW